MSIMNIAYIQNLVESIKADKMTELNAMSNNVEGQNSQDKLAHLAAAIWIADKMQITRWDFTTAWDAYLQKTKEALR